MVMVSLFQPAKHSGGRQDCVSANALLLYRAEILLMRGSWLRAKFRTLLYGEIYPTKPEARS
jgi:hypothetical protein